jgi:Arc/MetJ family transcription regulator
MKRTNLVLDEELLKRVTHALGVKTYSAAVNLSLAETLRVKKVQALPNFFGKGLWEGDLSEMREDRLSATHRGTSRRKTTKK